LKATFGELLTTRESVQKTPIAPIFSMVQAFAQGLIASWMNRFLLGELAVEEEIEEKDKANLRRVEQQSSEGTVEPLLDVCKTPSPPAGPVPIPYPNTARSSDASSGSKTVKTEGKEVLPKNETDFEKSSGDEASTSDGESEIGSLKEVAKTKVLGVPLWVWGLLVVAVLVAIWILASNAPQPIEQY